VAFIERLKQKHALDERAALKQFCLLCLNANEFVYLRLRRGGLLYPTRP
jgi:hypothetical protein